MPDILIRGMEMPRSCAACDFYNVISGRCTRTGTKINFSELTTRSVDCPISELPPHGRLIDVDERLGFMFSGAPHPLKAPFVLCTASVNDFKRIIENAPTVVPAERSDANG